jgi:hypothetical protein
VKGSLTETNQAGINPIPIKKNGLKRANIIKNPPEESRDNLNLA